MFCASISQTADMLALVIIHSTHSILLKSNTFQFKLELFEIKNLLLALAICAANALDRVSLLTREVH